MAMTRLARTLVVILVLTAAVASAQLATAELNGRVTDSSGAVLPGATVTATQTATGLVRTAVTDENGAYLISNLPTGPYRLEVSLQGFRTYAQTGIVLHANVAGFARRWQQTEVPPRMPAGSTPSRVGN